MDPRNLGERIEASASLDSLVEPVRTAAAAVVPRGPAKDALHGVWLGHPLHPLLTDLPIGFWTSAFMLDLVGGRRAQRASDTLVGLGVVSALPTAAAGLADWSELNRPEQRTGLLHAAANLVATGLYAWSYVARRRGHRTAGVVLGMAGATAATAGGFLGGHLSFRRAAGVNHAVSAPSPTEWADVALAGTLTADRPIRAELDGSPLAAIEGKSGPVALYAKCSHLGGPLDEGDLVDGCLRCPWHASMFRLDDGKVLRGPATAPQPVYELQVQDERVRARRRPL